MKKLKKAFKAMYEIVKAHKELNRLIKTDPVGTRRKLLALNESWVENYVAKCEKEIRRKAKENEV